MQSNQIGSLTLVAAFCRASVAAFVSANPNPHHYESSPRSVNRCPKPFALSRATPPRCVATEIYGPTSSAAATAEPSSGFCRAADGTEITVRSVSTRATSTTGVRVTERASAERRWHRLVTFGVRKASTSSFIGVRGAAWSATAASPRTTISRSSRASPTWRPGSLAAAPRGSPVKRRLNRMQGSALAFTPELTPSR